MSHRQILYHIVFCTYRRENTLAAAHQEALYRYIWGILRRRNCVLYRINGTENHLHILSDLNPRLALADLIKEIKTASNSWMHVTGHFPHFTSWAKGSCSLTYAYKDKDIVVNYIRNQKEHHRKTTFEDEYKALLKEHGIEADERYIFCSSGKLLQSLRKFCYRSVPRLHRGLLASLIFDLPATPSEFKDCHANAPSFSFLPVPCSQIFLFIIKD